MSDPGYREKCLSQKINVCNACGTGERLVVHHINGDRSDDTLENLVPLCRSCHTRLHVAAEVPDRLADLRAQLPESAIVTHDGIGDDSPRIRVSEPTWKALNRRKTPGDSFNDVLSRLFADG